MCEIAPLLGGFSDTNDKMPWKCFPPFQTKTNSLQWMFGHGDTEDTSEFGGGPATAEGNGNKTVGRWKFNRDKDEPGFMDYKTMSLYPAPGYTVDLPNRESPLCLRAFGSEGVELNHESAWSDKVASWKKKIDAAMNNASASANNANASAAAASAGGSSSSSSGTAALAECEVLNKIVELYEYGFVDLQTRGLYLDFNLYHPSLDRMVLVRVFFEFRPSGGVLPILDYIVFRPDKYHTFFDVWVVLLAEGITLLMVFAYTVEEIIHVIKCVYDPKSPWYTYFTKPGTAPHIVNLFLFLVVFGMSYVARVKMPSIIDPSGNAYVSLWSPGNWYRGAKALTSINVLLTWLKIFRYISFVPVFAQISRVLEASFRACFGFIVVIVLVGFALATAFLLAFGTRVEGFKNLTEAASSVFMGFLGDISLNELREANYWLGPLLFIIFLLLGIFVLLNMFIAIIGEAYSTTKEAMQREAAARKIHRDPSAQDLIQLYMRHVLFTMKGPGQLAAALNTKALQKTMSAVGYTGTAGRSALGRLAVRGGGVAGGMMGSVTGVLGLRQMYGGGGRGGGVGVSDDADRALGSEAARLREAGQGKGPGEANIKKGWSGGESGRSTTDAAAPVAVNVPPETTTTTTTTLVMPFSADEEEEADSNNKNKSLYEAGAAAKTVGGDANAAKDEEKEKEKETKEETTAAPLPSRGGGTSGLVVDGPTQGAENTSPGGGVVGVYDVEHDQVVNGGGGDGGAAGVNNGDNNNNINGGGSVALANQLQDLNDLMRETRMGVTEMRSMMRQNKELLFRMAEMTEMQKTLHNELSALQSSIILGGGIP